MAISERGDPGLELKKGESARRPGARAFPAWLASSFIIFLFFLTGVSGVLNPSAGAATAVRAMPAEIPCVWTDVERIIVIGDLHGDYENFEKIIRGKRIELVDSGLHWTGGKTHLVQTGDIMDRGDEAWRILDLLMKLQSEAEAAGGKVHVLIGNHEELNVGGMISRYPDYVTWRQFFSFLPDRYRRAREKELERRIKRAQARNLGQSPEEITAEFWNDIWNDNKNDPESEGWRQYLVGFNDKYGDWLLRRNAAIKINDTIFVHGGISEKYSLWGIEKINDRLRFELAQMQQVQVYGKPLNLKDPEVLYQAEGPLWYRELATHPEQDMSDEVDRILANLDAKHMVIAHTPQTAVTLKLMKRFNGKVWIIDTGISRAYNNNLSALKIENGVFTVWEGDHEEKDGVGSLGPLAYGLLPWNEHRPSAGR